jgi:hypothetical protein
MPNPKKITATPIIDTYTVRDDKDIIATPIVGDGQPGGISMRVGAKEVATGNESVSANLGKGKDVRGKTLRVVGMIQRENVQDARTSMRLTLTGGNPNPGRWDSARDGELHQQVTHIFSIDFV